MSDILVKRRTTIHNNVLLELMRSNNIGSYAELMRLVELPYERISTIRQMTCSVNNSSLIIIAGFFNVTPEYIISDNMRIVSRKFYDKLNKEEKVIDSTELLPLLECTKTVELDYDAERQENAENVREAIESLSEREKTIIKLRYYEKERQSDIGKRLDVSKERIMQIQSKAEYKMKIFITKKLGINVNGRLFSSDHIEKARQLIYE